MQQPEQVPLPRFGRRGLILSALWGLLLWVLAAGLTMWSADFGHHWDEPRAIDKAQHSLVERTILPGIYTYPSLMHGVLLLTLSPEVISGEASDASAWTAEFRQRVLIRGRSANAWLSLLSIMLVATLTWITTRDPLATLIAPLMLATSFEYAYHSRWLAPDGLLATAGILSLTALVVAALRQSTRWLMIGAAIAGAACSAKYPGGILLIPTLLVVRQIEPPGRRFRRALLCAALFSGVFLVITPGAIFDIDRLIADVRHEIRVYASGHGAYATTSPVHHFLKMVTYLATVFPSPHRIAAVAMAVPMVWGVVALFRGDRRVFNVLGVTLIAYALYFSSQSVMIVRNYLLVMPILAVMTGIGIADARRRTYPGAGLVLVGGLAVLGIWGGTTILDDALTVRNRHQSDALQEFRQFASEHPASRFAASARVHAALGAEARALGIVAEGPYEFVVAFQREPQVKTVVNVPGYVAFSTGPREVNLDYYSSWAADDRIVLLDPAIGGAHWPSGWIVLEGPAETGSAPPK